MKLFLSNKKNEKACSVKNNNNINNNNNNGIFPTSLPRANATLLLKVLGKVERAVQKKGIIISFPKWPTFTVENISEQRKRIKPLHNPSTFVITDPACSFGSAAITEYPRLSGFNSRRVFSQAEVQGQGAHRVETSLHGLQTAASHCLYVAFSGCVCPRCLFL